MPVVNSDQDTTEKARAHKGLIFLIGVAGSIVLWLIGYGSNMLVYTSQNPLPAALPILLSLPVAWLVNRISKVYPGSASIFLYSVVSVLGVILGVTILTTLPLSVSWTEVSVGTSVISFVYPLVAIGYSRWLEIFIERLGLRDGEDSSLHHIDTLTAAAKLNPREVAPRDFSKAIKVVGEENGVEIIQLDFDELENAERPIAHQSSEVADVVKSKRKPAVRKPVAKKVEPVAEVVPAEVVAAKLVVKKVTTPRKTTTTTTTPRKTTARKTTATTKTTARKTPAKKPPVS